MKDKTCGNCKFFYSAETGGSCCNEKKLGPIDIPQWSDMTCEHHEKGERLSKIEMMRRGYKAITTTVLFVNGDKHQHVYYKRRK
jgi:hypothetical protein